MTDLSKLSADQLDVAEQMATMFGRAKLPLTQDKLDFAFKIADEAKRQGISSQFVLPLVMSESKFDPKAISPTGAIGLMQLQPDTAKGLKVDPNDVDQNISGGVSLIKELMGNPKIGDDPYKVLIGYNTSAKTRNAFFDSGDLTILPKETLDYMENASDYFGGQLPSPVFTPPAAEASNDQAGTVAPIGGLEAQESEPVPAKLIGGIGAGLGVVGGTAAATLEAKKDAAQKGMDLIEALQSKKAAAVNPTKEVANLASEISMSPSDAQHERAIQGTTEEGVSGRSRQTTYNERTKAIAEAAKKKAKEIEAMRRLGLVTGEGADLSKYGHVASTPAGVLTTANAAEDFASSAANAAKAVAPAVAESSPLWNYAKHLMSYPLKGALTGAQIAGGAADVTNRARAGRTGEAITSAVGNTAGAVSPYLEWMATKVAPRLAPMAGGVAAPLAGIAGVAAPLYLTAADRLRHLEKHPEEYQLPEVVNGMRFGPMGEPYRD